MAYGVEQDRLRAILPDGYSSLRPVLRINAEINGERGYAELNTAVEHDGIRGWLNIACWDDIAFKRCGETVVFENGQLEIGFTAVGIEGGCPAEKDNAGCFFISEQAALRPPEVIDKPKEFCDCKFRWKTAGGTLGESIGKTLPAVPTEAVISYPKQPLTVRNAAAIPCQQVLGCYKVVFYRKI